MSKTLADVRETFQKRGDGNVAIDKLKATGVGFSTGGKHPSPPLHGYSLLCWSHAGHPKFGHGVFLEDGKASVEQVAKELTVNPNLDAITAKFGTSVEHVSQAVDYAVKAGTLGV
jgi:hypothetical protein